MLGILLHIDHIWQSQIVSFARSSPFLSMVTEVPDDNKGPLCWCEIQTAFGRNHDEKLCFLFMVKIWLWVKTLASYRYALISGLWLFIPQSYGNFICCDSSPDLASQESVVHFRLCDDTPSNGSPSFAIASSHLAASFEVREQAPRLRLWRGAAKGTKEVMEINLGLATAMTCRQAPRRSF